MMPTGRHYSRSLRRGDGPQGFTLMEVLVAIAILALMSAMTYSALVPALQAKDRVERLQVAYNRMSRFLNRFERELRGAYFGVNSASTRKGCLDRPEQCPYNFTGKNNGESDELRFVTTSLSVSAHKPSSDEAIISYFVGKGMDESGSAVPALLRQQSLLHGQNTYTKYVVAEREVLPDVTRFNLRYLRRGTEDEWVDDWDSTDELEADTYGHLPRAVEVTVAYEDPDAGSQTIYTVVTIPSSRPCKLPPGTRPDPSSPGKRVGDECP